MTKNHTAGTITACSMNKAGGNKTNSRSFARILVKSMSVAAGKTEEGAIQIAVVVMPVLPEWVLGPSTPSGTNNGCTTEFSIGDVPGGKGTFHARALYVVIPAGGTHALIPRVDFQERDHSTLCP